MLLYSCRCGQIILVVRGVGSRYMYMDGGYTHITQYLFKAIILTNQEIICSYTLLVCYKELNTLNLLDS